MSLLKFVWIISTFLQLIIYHYCYVKEFVYSDSAKSPCQSSYLSRQLLNSFLLLPRRKPVDLFARGEIVNWVGKVIALPFLVAVKSAHIKSASGLSRCWIGTEPNPFGRISWPYLRHPGRSRLCRWSDSLKSTPRRRSACWPSPMLHFLFGLQLMTRFRQSYSSSLIDWRLTVILLPFYSGRFQYSSWIPGRPASHESTLHRCRAREKHFKASVMWTRRPQPCAGCRTAICFPKSCIDMFDVILTTLCNLPCLPSSCFTHTHTHNWTSEKASRQLLEQRLFVESVAASPLLHQRRGAVTTRINTRSQHDPRTSPGSANPGSRIS
jgi:hypothetical protein